MNKFMQLAIKEAKKGVLNGDGGPFGAIVVKNGKMVGKGHNCVVKKHDPTCHGEMEAIRNACKKLNTFDLSDCELYTTGEPCPMCLAGCLWANIKKVYFGCTILDNEKIGFRDNKFDKLMGGRKSLKSYLSQIDRDECLKVFKEYNNIKDKVNY